MMNPSFSASEGAVVKYAQTSAGYPQLHAFPENALTHVASPLLLTAVSALPTSTLNRLPTRAGHDLPRPPSPSSSSSSSPPFCRSCGPRQPPESDLGIIHNAICASNGRSHAKLPSSSGREWNTFGGEHTQRRGIASGWVSMKVR